MLGPSITALVAAAAALVRYAQGSPVSTTAPVTVDYLVVGGGTAGECMRRSRTSNAADKLRPRSCGGEPSK
jgi:hypothetical protein